MFHAECLEQTLTREAVGDDGGTDRWHRVAFAFAFRFASEEKFSTVGCVCRDRHGNLAAAGSTGGLCNKQPGRVGDTPIVGAGV